MTCLFLLSAVVFTALGWGWVEEWKFKVILDLKLSQVSQIFDSLLLPNILPKRSFSLIPGFAASGYRQVISDDY